MNDDLNYTPEMEDWFLLRTKFHIGLVQKYARKIEEYDPVRFKGLEEASQHHDESKFEDPEKTPYVFIAWNYHSKDLGKPFELPQQIKDKMNEATLHHVKSSPHHPEYWAPEASIKLRDRDSISNKIVDATAMPDLYIGEMIADWKAMSEEKGTSTLDWADKTVNTRWFFTTKQTNLIYELIDNIEGN